ncbi:hypothetical protein GCM10017559_24920 [Streptosporangium longisporum]|uniref:Uncharacterized protein n=1 Tax=Streptosporangium longisporum TaxID=46187 RepID=A0ABP6KDA7_9ACTN
MSSIHLKAFLFVEARELPKGDAGRDTVPYRRKIRVPAGRGRWATLREDPLKGNGMVAGHLKVGLPVNRDPLPARKGVARVS